MVIRDHQSTKNGRQMATLTKLDSLQPGNITGQSKIEFLTEDYTLNTLIPGIAY